MSPLIVAAEMSTWEWLSMFWHLNIDRVLLVGWSILAVLTVIASLGMFVKLLKPHKGLWP